MIQVTVNQTPVKVLPGATVLEAVRFGGADLPTLCDHQGLAPYGACRLCLVSLSSPRRELVAACTRPAEDGMAVETASTEAVQARRLTLEFLLARCPQSTVIQNLAARAGLVASRFASETVENDAELCVLCGLCVRVCREVIGAAAIGFTGRGERRRVGTPFGIQSEACIGCGACAGICPTGAIRMEDSGPIRILHTFNTRVALKPCARCQRFWAPQPMDAIKARFPQAETMWDLCPRCRRQSLARPLKDLPVPGRPPQTTRGR